MSLDEVFTEDPQVSRSSAIRCIREHGISDIDEFLAEMGDVPEYSSKSVLEWLGY